MILKTLENYRFEGELHRAAMTQLPHVQALTIKEKEELSSAYKYGWWLGIGVQAPVILSATYFFKHYVPKFTPERKMFSYTMFVGAYGMFYMVTKAWAWHQAFYKVEHIIKQFILTAEIDEIRKIQQEQSLGISKDKNLYIPKE